MRECPYCDASAATEAALVAENKRLTEALEKIAQRANETTPGPLGYQDTVFAMHEIARNAIGPQ